jgi:hypothetical protein
MTAWRERDIVRLIHLVLSVPILGYFYGPVEHIPHAAFFARWIAMPIVLLSGLWMWLKPRVLKRIVQARLRPEGRQTLPAGNLGKKISIRP